MPMKRHVSTAISRISLVIGQLVYIKIITRYLGSVELGVYYFAITASYFLNAALFVPFDYYQQAQVHKAFKAYSTLKHLVDRNKSLLGIVGAVTLLLAVINFVFLGKGPWLMVVCAGFAITTYATQAMRGALNTLGYTAPVNQIQLLEAFLKPSAALVFSMLVVSVSATEMILLNFMALTVVLAVEVLVFRRFGLLKPSENIPEKLDLVTVAKVSVPISFGALFNWIQLQGYRLVLVPLGYAEIVGIYSVMTNLGQAGMSAASAIYTQINMPKMYVSNGQHLRSYILGALTLIGVMAMAAWIVSPLLVPYVTKGGYRDYAYLVLFGVFVEGANLLLGAYVVYASLMSATRSLAVFGACAAALSAGGLATFYAFHHLTLPWLGATLVLSQVFMVVAFAMSHRKKNTA